MKTTYLAIFAHPDDESFGPGGTLARLSNEGNKVILLTLTRGEAGQLGISKTLSRQELAARRTAELTAAAEVLGAKLLPVGNLPDKCLSELNPEDGLHLIRQAIKKFQPHALITFHPNGISGHPDHKCVSHWVQDAAREAETQPVVFFYGLSRKQAGRITHRQLHPIAQGEITHRLDVDNTVEQKIAAIRCHHTQSDLWEQMQQLPGDIRTFFRYEHFVQAIPATHSEQIGDSLIVI